jgi:hypothetical protein
MTKSGQAQDEAMDAILASIRSMMSDGEAGKPSPSPVMEESRPVPVAGNVSKLFSAPPAAPVVIAPMPSVRPIDAHLPETPDDPIPDEAPAMQSDPAVELAMVRAMEEARAEIERGGAEAKEEAPAREEPSRPAPVASISGDDRPQPRPAVSQASRTATSQLVRSEQDQSPGPLLSRDADAAVSSAFQDLATSVLSGSGRTIDDVVEDLLRPMLRDWLDDNLPSMVERLVREEIERVARGRR